MVTGPAFRWVQRVGHWARMMYWEVFVLFVSALLALGGTYARPRLNKVPASVAVCVELPKRNTWWNNAGSREAEQKQLAALATRCADAAAWCIDAGVDEITFFESSGRLSQAAAREVFCKHAQHTITRPHRKSMLFGKLGRVRNILVFCNGEETPVAQVRCAASAEEATEDVHIRFLSEQDGNRDLAMVTQQLVDERSINPEGITEGLLNSRLSSSRGTRDKLNLVLTYTESPNLMGFPGWLTRTPEILNIPQSLVDSNYAAFVWAMFKYSKTEQRWGR